MPRSAPLLVTLCLVVFPALAQAQDSDTTPPILTALDFNPKTVDVREGPVTLTVSGTLTDDLSGPNAIQLSFRSPSGRQFHWGFATRVALTNTVSGNVTIPQYVEAGTWQADVWASDNVGNRVHLDAAVLADLGLPSTISVASNPDTDAPVVVSADFTPELIDVSNADQVVALETRVTDNLSGIDTESTAYNWGFLFSPSAHRYIIERSQFRRISGTTLDGIYRLDQTIPRYSEAGTWRLYMQLRDGAGNFSPFILADTFDVYATVQDRTPPTITGLRFTPAVINTSTGSVIPPASWAPGIRA